jgi:hypothetical protein
MGEVGTRRWAARRGADGSAQSRRGAGVSRVRERERARVGAAGRGVGFLYERGEAVRAVEKYLGRHCAQLPRFMARWVPPYLQDGLFQGQWCGYSMAYKE